MKLDHIAVTRIPSAGGPGGRYQVRAELSNQPSPDWCASFRAAWRDSPNCRRVSPDVQLIDNSIFVRLNDARRVTETVDLLKRMTDRVMP